MRSSRGTVQCVELLSPAREWRGSRRAQARRAVTVIELGVRAISDAPFAKSRGGTPNARSAECRGKNDVSECVECGGIALEVRSRGGVRTSDDQRKRNNRGE